jgi:hypothetical protein
MQLSRDPNGAPSRSHVRTQPRSAHTHAAAAPSALRARAHLVALRAGRLVRRAR